MCAVGIIRGRTKAQAHSINASSGRQRLCHHSTFCFRRCCCCYSVTAWAQTHFTSIASANVFACTHYARSWCATQRKMPQPAIKCENIPKTKKSARERDKQKRIKFHGEEVRAPASSMKWFFSREVDACKVASAQLISERLSRYAQYMIAFLILIRMASDAKCPVPLWAWSVCIYLNSNSMRVIFIRMQLSYPCECGV